MFVTEGRKQVDLSRVRWEEMIGFGGHKTDIAYPAPTAYPSD